MIFDAVYYRERARRAVDELRDVRACYDGMVKAHGEALVREQKLQASLREALDIAEAQGDMCRQLEAERDDARREVDEVRAALVWLERDFKVGGAA